MPVGTEGMNTDEGVPVATWDVAGGDPDGPARRLGVRLELYADRTAELLVTIEPGGVWAGLALAPEQVQALRAALGVLGVGTDE